MPANRDKEELLLSTVSMTGYGRSAFDGKQLALEVEIKSLNSRYLDVICRLPREYGQYEIELRELLAGKLRRGRVELAVTRRALQSNNLQYQFNQALFDSYLNIWSKALLKKVRRSKSANLEAGVLEALRRREILDIVEETSHVSAEKGALFSCVEKALAALHETRKREGGRLGQDMFARLPKLIGLLERMGKLAEKNNDLLRERLRNKVSTLGLDLTLDQGRLTSEVALLADRQDVSEELVRLGVHVSEIGNSLGVPGSGRKLDFLLQECAREINTLGAKTVDLSLQELVLELKLEFEKLREQVQNVE